MKGCYMKSDNLKIDIADLYELAEEIKNYTAKVEKLGLEIQYLEAKVVEEVTTNSKYFQNGKTPSMAFIESSYKFKGTEDMNLYEKRVQLAELKAALVEAKLRYEVYMTKIEIWRTESANQRKMGNAWGEDET